MAHNNLVLSLIYNLRDNKGILSERSYPMFGSKHKAKIQECAIIMADIILNAIESGDDLVGDEKPNNGPESITEQMTQIADSLSEDISKEEFAYLQGYRVIEYNRLGTFDTRRLVNWFRDALVDKGLSISEATIIVNKFWVYYWTMIVGSTEGVAQRFALKRVRRSQEQLIQGQQNK